MSANRINPDHVLAKSWMNFKLAEMEAAELERVERIGNEAGTGLGPYEIGTRGEVGQEESNKRVGAGKGKKGKGKKTRGEEGIITSLGEMENFMNSHGIKPYDDGAFEAANAISEQLRGIKWEPSDDEQQLRTIPKKGRRGRKSVVEKFGGMENFMNSHGIKPYDDWAFEEAHAIVEQLQGIKQESGAGRQAPGRVAKKKNKSGRGKRGKRAN